jgi:hypothetical protein
MIPLEPVSYVQDQVERLSIVDFAYQCCQNILDHQEQCLCVSPAFITVCDPLPET